FVRHTGDGRRGMVFHRHLLAAVCEVPAGIGRPPGARGVEGVPTMTGRVGYRVEDGDGRSAASVAGGRRIEGPGDGKRVGLVAHASNRRFGGVLPGYFLTAIGGVAAGVGCPPGAGGIEGVAAMTGEVGDGAKDSYGRAAASVAGGRRIEGP